MESWKHFRAWTQLTCPKISRKLLIPQLLFSQALGKSNHLEVYLVGGGQVDLPICFQKLLYRSLCNFSLNFRFVESSVFGRIHMSLAFCSCNGDWDHTFRSVFRVQPEAHHHLYKYSTSRISNVFHIKWYTQYMHTTDVNIYLRYVFMIMLNKTWAFPSPRNIWTAVLGPCSKRARILTK